MPNRNRSYEPIERDDPVRLWGEKLVARGEVLSAGRRLFVCRAEVEAVDGEERRKCATLLQTISLSPATA